MSFEKVKTKFEKVPLDINLLNYAREKALFQLSLMCAYQLSNKYLN